MSPGQVEHRSAGDARWYRDSRTLRFIGLRYLPLLALLSLAWEWAHVPLYTLGEEAGRGYVAYAVVHCTAGDVLIGAAALVLALVIRREGAVGRWNVARVAALTMLIGTAYTVFSEWMNVVARGSWSYAAAMPTVPLGSFEIGLTPVLQWLLIPPGTLYLATRRR